MELNSYLKLSLRKLFGVFKKLFANPTRSAEYSTLCRFIFQSNHFSIQHGKPKPNAFLPAPGKTQISMHFVDSLAPSEIWVLGDMVGEGRGKPCKARAEMNKDAIGEVEQCKLRIVPDPKPHPLHVNIAGWPAEKDAQKAIAIELCVASTLYTA